MKAVRFYAPGDIRYEEISRPIAGPGEVLVQVKAALTCGTDLKAFLRGHPQIPPRGPFGHEFAGVVAEVGEGVTTFRPGDPVMAVHSAPCGDCYWCRRGEGNLCPAVMDTKILGAYAEYIKVPAHIVRQNMFRKPDSLGFEEAALLEPLSCVVHGLRSPEPLRIRPDDTVVLIGAGAIALLHLMVLRALGVQRIIVAGRHRYRLELARRLGASLVLNVDSDPVSEAVRDATGGRGADLVVECAGRPEVWQQAVDLCRRGGRVILFGGCPKGSTVTFDTARLHYDQITLHSPFHFTPAAVRRAYELLAEGKIQGRALITSAFPLDRVADVFRMLQTGDCVKYALIP